MAKINIIAQKINNQLYAAIQHKKKVMDLYADSLQHFPRWGALYLAKVEKIDTNLDGAFLNLGGNQKGFLPAKHVHKSNMDTKNESIGTLLDPGQMIIVQVKAEGRQQTDFEHQKLPRMTMKVYVPGRLLVFSPTANKVTVSRKVENRDIFKVAGDLKSKGGWIIRDAAEFSTPEDVVREAKHLKSIWKDVIDARSNSPDKPRILYKGANAICRTLIDYAGHDVVRIEITDECNPDYIRNWCENHVPSLCDKIEVVPASKTDLFEHHDIYATLEDATSSVIQLEGGGSLIIEDTHALTVIDVNRGNAKNIKALNTAAAQEVARQLRIRNLSGAILADFLNLRLRSDRYELVETLEHAVEHDPGNTQIHGFTRLGIMEITRTRRTAMLSEKHEG